MTVKTVNSMIEFIYANSYLLDTYDVNELWIKTAVNKFKKETGYYPNASKWEWSVDYLGWRLKNTNELTYEEILNNFNEFIQKSSFSIQENKEKYEFNYIVEKTSFDGAKTFYLYGSYNFDSLLNLLHYAINEKMENNLGLVQKWMNQKGINSNTSFSNEHFAELGVYVTKYKNGKITVKGLSDRAIKNLNRIYANCGK